MMMKALYFVVLLVATSLSFAGSPPFQTATVNYQVLADEQRFDGLMEAVHRSTISAQTAGEIVELPFDVNDYVPKDAVVIRFDDVTQKAKLDQAVANEAQAQARLKEAESAFLRNQRLIKEKAVSQSQLEKSEADLKSAKARLELTRAVLKEAQEQFDYTVMRAPFAGVLVERFVEIGEQIQVGQKLGTGLSLERLRVKVEVPESYIQAIRNLQKARVRLPDAQGTWLEAEKLTIFPYADEHSHSFTIRVDLPEGQHGLYPGMLVKVAFSTGEHKRLVVPSRAIVHRSEVTGVYVVGDSDRLSFRQIRIGREQPGDLTVVLAGLEAEERIALDPVAAGIRLKQQNSGQQNHE